MLQIVLFGCYTYQPHPLVTYVVSTVQAQVQYGKGRQAIKCSIHSLTRFYYSKAMSGSVCRVHACALENSTLSILLT